MGNVLSTPQTSTDAANKGFRLNMSTYLCKVDCGLDKNGAAIVPKDGEFTDVESDWAKLSTLKLMHNDTDLYDYYWSAQNYHNPRDYMAWKSHLDNQQYIEKRINYAPWMLPNRHIDSLSTQCNWINKELTENTAGAFIKKAANLAHYSPGCDFYMEPDLTKANWFNQKVKPDTVRVTPYRDDSPLAPYYVTPSDIGVHARYGVLFQLAYGPEKKSPVSVFDWIDSSHFQSVQEEGVVHYVRRIMACYNEYGTIDGIFPAQSYRWVIEWLSKKRYIPMTYLHSLNSDKIQDDLYDFHKGERWLQLLDRELINHNSAHWHEMGIDMAEEMPFFHKVWQRVINTDPYVCNYSAGSSSFKAKPCMFVCITKGRMQKHRSCEHFTDHNLMGDYEKHCFRKRVGSENGSSSVESLCDSFKYQCSIDYEDSDVYDN